MYSEIRSTYDEPLTLAKNAVMLIDLIPAEDHTSEYYELDSEFYDSLSLPQE